MVSESSRTGHKQKKTINWIVNMRGTRQATFSAIHTTKQITVANRGNQNTLKYKRNCT